MQVGKLFPDVQHKQVYGSEGLEQHVAKLCAPPKLTDRMLAMLMSLVVLMLRSRGEDNARQPVNSNEETKS